MVLKVETHKQTKTRKFRQFGVSLYQYLHGYDKFRFQKGPRWYYFGLLNSIEVKLQPMCAVDLLNLDENAQITLTHLLTV